MKPTRHARRSRRVPSRLTRVLALAVAGPLIMGSLAYAAGVGPVRRHVNEFLKGTARLFHKAESSTGQFHVSPNPIGRGVLVMPIDDRGPRPVSESGPDQGDGKAKEEKSTPGSHGPKQKTDPATALDSKDDKSNSTSGETKETEKAENADESKESDSGSGSGEGGSGSSEQDRGDSDDEHSGGDSGGSDDDHSGSGSSSGESDSHSEKD